MYLRVIKGLDSFSSCGLFRTVLLENPLDLRKHLSFPITHL